MLAPEQTAEEAGVAVLISNISFLQSKELALAEPQPDLEALFGKDTTYPFA